MSEQEGSVAVLQAESDELRERVLNLERFISQFNSGEEPGELVFWF